MPLRPFLMPTRLLSVCLTLTLPGAAGAADNPFGNPGAAWITTGRGIACASSEQLARAQAAILSADMGEFQTLSAGCIAPDAGLEVRIVDPGGPGPAKLVLVTGAEATGPWFAGPAFYRRGNGR